MIRVLAAMLIFPMPTAADECHRLYHDARVCLEAGQSLRHDTLISESGTTQLVEIMLEEPFPDDVYVSFLALRGNAGLTLQDWAEGLEKKVGARTGQQITRSETFRHRGAPGRILQIYDETDPADPIWGAYIGVEVSNGVVMTALSRRKPSSPTDIAQWAEAALNAFYPGGGS